MARPFTTYFHAPTQPGGKPLPPVTHERHTVFQVNPRDLISHDGSLQADDFRRGMQLVQDSIRLGTEPYRTNPLIHGAIHRQVTFITGQNVTIAHGLGEAWGSWVCRRAYPGSAPFAAVDAILNGGQDARKYLVLTSKCSGIYDIEINPSTDIVQPISIIANIPGPVGLLHTQEFLANGNFVAPATELIIEGCGGGGCGGDGYTGGGGIIGAGGSGAGGGGAALMSRIRFPNAVVGNTYVVVVGAGGATSGASGKDSKFDVILFQGAGGGASSGSGSAGGGTPVANFFSAMATAPTPAHGGDGGAGNSDGSTSGSGTTGANGINGPVCAVTAISGGGAIGGHNGLAGAGGGGGGGGGARGPYGAGGVGGQGGAGAANSSGASGGNGTGGTAAGANTGAGGGGGGGGGGSGGGGGGSGGLGAAGGSGRIRVSWIVSS